jgi:hypothetical protein
MLPSPRSLSRARSFIGNVVGWHSWRRPTAVFPQGIQDRPDHTSARPMAAADCPAIVVLPRWLAPRGVDRMVATRAAHLGSGAAPLFRLLC